MGNVISHPSNWTVVYGTCYELGHTWTPSCIHSSSEVFAYVFYEAMKIYVPLYLISNLMRKRDVMAILRSTISCSLQSSLFLSINGAGYVSFVCIVRRIIGRFYFITAGYIPSFCASMCAILVERKNRYDVLLIMLMLIGVYQERCTDWICRSYWAGDFVSDVEISWIRPISAIW
jgi:hypothetical protein